jgi:hypothetical protein
MTQKRRKKLHKITFKDSSYDTWSLLLMGIRRFVVAIVKNLTRGWDSAEDHVLWVIYNYIYAENSQENKDKGKIGRLVRTS